MDETQVKAKHDADDTKQMVATKLSVPIDGIEHIGLVPWSSRHGYAKLCNCQQSILFAVTVYMFFLFAIRDGDGAESIVLQGKCAACDKVYVAEIEVNAK